jgi:hypothetical protein
MLLLLLLPVLVAVLLYVVLLSRQTLCQVCLDHGCRCAAVTRV